MKRRDIIKLIAVAPASGAVLSACAREQAASPAAPASSVPAGKSAGKASVGGSGTGEVPHYAKDFLTSDMNGLGPDGKPTGQTMTFTGASRAGVTAETAGKEMTLTDSILPARESDNPGSNKALADPVSRKRPGTRCSSTACLMETNNSGNRCTSSSATRVPGDSNSGFRCEQE